VQRTEKSNTAEEQKPREEAKEKGVAFPIYDVYSYGKHGAPAVPMGQKRRSLVDGESEGGWHGI
jgi:hypothetical protein